MCSYLMFRINFALGAQPVFTKILNVVFLGYSKEKENGDLLDQFKDSWSLDCLLLLKNFKTPFFRDISNSFMWVTQSYLKPHHFFFFEKILKTVPASSILRFF